MLDTFGRNINYLRISVTDRCNLHCRYCAPLDDDHLCAHEDILSFEQITEIAKIAAGLGINKIRLTGGEPLIRRNIVELVRMLSAIDGIDDLAMTTNGLLLAKHAKDLKQAGLRRVNVSLDTTNPEKFFTITNGGNVADVMSGIDAALDAKLVPLKINCVVIKNFSTEQDILSVKEYAANKEIEIRFVNLMDFKTGAFSQVDGGSGGDCKHCNRLRLLSNGNILPCLFSDATFDTKKLGVREAILQSIRHKPEKGTSCQQECMRNIGG